MRKLMCLLLAGILVLGITACGNNQTDETQNPTTSTSPSDDTHQEEIPAPAPSGPTTKKEDLGENMCVTKDDVPFSKVIKLNDYEFTLGCKLTDFLVGIDGNYIYTDEFQAFQDERNKERCWIEISVEKDGEKSIFDAMVEYNEQDELILASLAFDSEDAPFSDLCVGLEVFGMDALNSTNYSFPIVLQDAMVFISEKDAYSLVLISYYDDYSYSVTFDYDEEFKVYKISRLSVNGK